GYINKNIKIGMRPEDIRDEPIFIKANQINRFTTKDEVAELLGSDIMIHIKLNQENLIAQIDARNDLSAGKQVELAFDMNKCYLFDTYNGHNLLKETKQAKTIV